MPRRKRLGSARHVHAKHEEIALSSTMSRVKHVHSDLDAVDRGDVYSCDAALFSLIDANRAHAEAWAESRGRGQPRNEPQSRNALNNAERRFFKICIRPDQKKQGER